MRRRLEGVGFSEVLVLPFYGHFYYHNFPVIRDIHRGLATLGLARKLDMRLLSSYAYIAVRKDG